MMPFFRRRREEESCVVMCHHERRGRKGKKGGMVGVYFDPYTYLDFFTYVPTYLPWELPKNRSCRKWQHANIDSKGSSPTLVDEGERGNNWGDEDQISPVFSPLSHHTPSTQQSSNREKETEQIEGGRSGGIIVVITYYLFQNNGSHIMQNDVVHCWTSSKSCSQG